MTVPRFWMPYANPEFDVDVSGQVHHNGLVEAGNTQIVHHNLEVSLSEDPNVTPFASIATGAID